MGTSITKVDAAVHQLDWAVRMLIDHQSGVAAITLAGAAEEILGKLVGDRAAMLRLRDALHKKTQAAGEEISPKEIVDQHLNSARNWLKHADAGDPSEVREFELEVEAVQYIVRGMTNLIALDRSAPSQAARFFAWLATTRPGLWETVGPSIKEKWGDVALRV